MVTVSVSDPRYLFPEFFLPLTWYFQGFGREKDGNRGKYINSNLVVFCYKEIERFTLCKSVSQSEAAFIVYSEPIESGHVKSNFNNEGLQN